jgi:AraC-like DNA-binding protein
VKSSVNPMARYMKITVNDVPERMSLAQASKYLFERRNPSRLHADCKFLGIDTTRRLDGYGSLTRKNAFILYMFLAWRAFNPDCDRKKYWKDCAMDDVEPGVELSVHTASDLKRLEWIAKVGSSEAHFNREFDKFLESRRTQIRQAKQAA